MDNNKIQLFESKRIRSVWVEGEEEWYFSIVDVVAVLTESPDPAAYWRKLKQRLREEGNFQFECQNWGFVKREKVAFSIFLCNGKLPDCE